MCSEQQPTRRLESRWHWVLLSVLGVALAVPAFWAFLRPPTKPKVAETPVARTNLVFLDGRWYQLPQTNLFTGFMVEFYPDGSLYSRCAVSNGLLNGVSEAWYTNGQAQIRESYRDSVADGLRQKWYENGRLKSEATVVQGKLEGLFRSWYENGQLAEQINMKRGSPDGKAWAYYSSGFVKAETQVRAGEVLSRQTWQDGEHSASRLASADLPKTTAN